MPSTADTDILEPSVDPTTRKMRLRHVTATNAATARTRAQVRDLPAVFTDEPGNMGGTNSAPTPLETVLVALVGCDGAIIHGVAKAMGFAYDGVDFDCESQIDVRGPKGVPGIRPFFESVRLDVVLYSDEPRRRFDQLKKNVELRCPVMNLLTAADVKMTVTWSQRPAAEYPGFSD